MNKTLVVLMVVVLLLVAGETGYIVAIKSFENAKTSENMACVNSDRNLINTLNNELGLFDNIVALITLARPKKSFVQGSITSVFQGTVDYASLIDNSQVLLLNFVPEENSDEKNSFIFKIKDVVVKGAGEKDLKIEDIKKGDRVVINAFYDVKALKFAITITKK